MARKIVWTKRANNNYNGIIEYLEADWEEQVIIDFVKKTYKILGLICEYPHLGSIENQEKGIHGFLITSHNRLFYRFSDTELVLLNFFDTRQQAGKRKF